MRKNLLLASILAVALSMICTGCDVSLRARGGSADWTVSLDANTAD